MHDLGMRKGMPWNSLGLIGLRDSFLASLVDIFLIFCCSRLPPIP